MGCFLACFGKDNGKRRKPKSKTLTRDRRGRNYASLPPSSPLKEAIPESELVSVPESRGIPAVVSVPESRDKPAVVPVPELRDKPVVVSVPELRDKHENLSFNNRKKVTFNLNVKTYDEVSIHEAPNYSLEIDNSEEKEREKEDEKAEKESSVISLSEDNITGSYRSNHRYQNCIASDDEVGDDEEEYEDSDFDDTDDDRDGEEESFESYFSLSMDKEQEICSSPRATKEVIDSRSVCGSVDPKPKILANGARDRSHYVHSVLNPVENLSQWKAAKAKTTPVKHQKENVVEQPLHIPFSAEPTFKAPKQLSYDQYPSFNVSKHPPKQEVSVDTSLSNWLVTPASKTNFAGSESSEQSTPRKSYSSINREDRPILGALTIEQLKSSVTSSSPRRSPSRSPDDIPILGTVGTYWSHNTQSTSSNSPCRSTGSDSEGTPNTAIKYTEDKRVNWYSTPFEVRLERALNRGAAEDCSSYPPRVC